MYPVNDLLGSMAEAASSWHPSAINRSEFRVTVSVVYRDFASSWYRTHADLIYIPTQRRLKFGPSKQERVVHLESEEGSTEPINCDFGSGCPRP